MYQIGIPNLPLSRNKQTQTRVLPIFQIYGQSILNENCHHFITSNDIEIKIGPATKEEEVNVKKKLEDDFMLASCDIITIFLIHGQFGAIWVLDSGSLIVIFHLTKTETKLKNL